MPLFKRKSPQQKLFNAIADADIEKVRKILEANSGIDINATNGRNMTALDACAEKITEEIQKPAKTLSIRNWVMRKINTPKIKALDKKMIALADVWNEIANSSGTLKRYAGDQLFDNDKGSFYLTGATVSIACRTPKKTPVPDQISTSPRI